MEIKTDKKSFELERALTTPAETSHTDVRSTETQAATSVALLISPSNLDPVGAFTTTANAASTIGTDSTISLTSTQLNNLFTAPVTLIPTPGTNKVNVITAINASFAPGTAAFTGEANISIVYGTSSSGEMAWAANFSPLIQQTTDSITSTFAAGGFDTTDPSTTLASYFNQPISLVASGAITGSGNGTLSLAINYQTFTIPPT